MGRIVLRCGTEVLVDDCDVDWLSEWEWHLSGGYAATGQRRKVEGKYKKVLMHVVIAKASGLRIPNKHEVDHRDRNKLNNQRNNLRVVSKSINQHNSGTRADSSTGVRGVTLTPQGSYMARIQVDGKRVSLGRFDRIEDAIEARKRAEASRVLTTG